ncbi:MFS transporter [Lichenihabitans sp. Uapishka_5]|nr:MFS transporter [Lichenihabitans sp. Uapishka_5]MDX7953221.1 MFS transporter [Lichenihabitans sp. Uapishka_5]
MVLYGTSLTHGLNDLIQSLVPAIYPILKTEFALDFGQIGLITLAFQLTASLLQPWIGLYTDRHPRPFLLPVGMGISLCGLLLLSVAPSYAILLVAASLVGVGSSIFHPESSRIARAASGGRHGFAQSLFQVGGYFGTALGPLLAAWIVVAHGQRSIAWFSPAAVLAAIILFKIAQWYSANLKKPQAKAAIAVTPHPRRTVWTVMTILVLLVFSKQFYLASMGSYFTFYLIDKFHLGVADAQLHLFLFLASVAVGTLVGGPIGDRIGRKYVIWVSILGVLPFTLALPYANLFWTSVLSVLIGLILSSAFSAIVVYAQDLMPNSVGMIAGLFFGLAFGTGGLGAAVLGEVADHTSIGFVYKLCSFLPMIGLLTWFIPATPHQGRPVAKTV